MHDERNIPELPTIEANVIQHAQGDMTPGHIAVSMQPEVGLGEAIKGIGGDIWDALTPAFALGAEEVSRALFTSNAYVYHGDTIPEQEPKHGLPAKEAEHEREI